MQADFHARQKKAHKNVRVNCNYELVEQAGNEQKSLWTIGEPSIIERNRLLKKAQINDKLGKRSNACLLDQLLMLGADENILGMIKEVFLSLE